jgi:hypothetical protein
MPDEESNIHPIVSLFPKWSIQAADGLWCAGFVYYCCIEAGFEIPYKPVECAESGTLAGCGSWEVFAITNPRINYYRDDPSFQPESGDIVLYDNVFCGLEHDHIGIVLKADDEKITVAEGNVDNVSAIMVRPRDEHIRAYIRIPDGYSYFE